MNTDEQVEALGRFAAWLAAAPFLAPFRIYCRIRRHHMPPQPPLPPPVDPWEQQRQQELDRERARANAKAECDEIRLACELFYSRHAKQLQATLPLDRFRTMLASYLSGQPDPEVVRKRTEMIQQAITDQVAAVQATGETKFNNLRQLADHFAKLRAEVQELPYDADIRDSFVMALNKQEDSAIEEFLKT